MKYQTGGGVECTAEENKLIDSLKSLNAGMIGAESFKEALDLAIVTLSQPSLPSNLDEAAEEYAWKKEEPLADGERLSSAFNPRIDAFKAGAEWMAAQGETIEGEVVKDIKNNLVVIAKGFSGKNAVFGDKVTVQIRKK